MTHAYPEDQLIEQHAIVSKAHFHSFHRPMKITD